MMTYTAINLLVELCDLFEHDRLPVIAELRFDRERLTAYGDDAMAKVLIETEIKTLVTMRLDRIIQLDAAVKSLYVVMFEQLGVELQNLVRSAPGYQKFSGERDALSLWSWGKLRAIRGLGTK